MITSKLFGVEIWCENSPIIKKDVIELLDNFIYDNYFKETDRHITTVYKFQRHKALKV